MSARFTEVEWIWMDGEFVRWHEAKVHILSLAVQFGSSVFEGVRCYKTPDGPAIFRLNDHLERLFNSCRVYRMEPTYTHAQIVDACAAIVKKNGLETCYMRPSFLRGYGAAGMHPAESPLQLVIPVWPWEVYLGPDALENGVDVCISTWQRPEPNTFPMLAKSAGNYNNAQLIKMEAVINGYAEAIALSPSGMVSEGSGQNMFLVKKGVLMTPPLDGSLLAGITRDTVIALARADGIEVREDPIPREMLYMADEMFFSGTASEITPIRSLDKITIGIGKAGPITKRLQRTFQDVVHGRVEDRWGWLTRINTIGQQAPAAAAAARARETVKA
jgi:branched-chain amino acid aminotransferase